MAEITASLVKELRERTGLGMMECKKALVESNGDIEVAIEELRKSSGMKAAKKAGRIAADGAVVIKTAADGSYGALLEVNSETDFVARDENFTAFAGTVLDKAFTAKQADVAALMAGELEDKRSALVQKIGENITVRRVKLLEAANGVVGGYVHSNNKIAVLVALNGGDAELAKDIAMHVAAVNPQATRPEDMDQALIEKEREIYTAQAADSGKPADIIAKMVEGRVKKFLAESSLTEQPFVKNPELTVGQLAKNAGATIVTFVRFEVGEGIEKEEVDFAAEVAAAAGLNK
jgi:elongation factor Ts